MPDTIKVRLDDHHPGEYTRFDADADARRATLASFNEAREAAGGIGFASDPGPGPTATLIEVDEGDGGYDCHWEIEGSTNDHLHLLTNLLGQLIAPAWDWYGMGGDDHCFDYWPNTMDLAADYRDALIPHLTTEEADRIIEEVRRVYWLCRMRFANEAPSFATAAPLPMMKGRPARDNADAVFESDILDASRFGAPIWKGE